MAADAGGVQTVAGGQFALFYGGAGGAADAGGEPGRLRVGGVLGLEGCGVSWVGI